MIQLIRKLGRGQSPVAGGVEGFLEGGEYAGGLGEVGQERNE